MIEWDNEATKGPAICRELEEILHLALSKNNIGYLPILKFLDAKITSTDYID